MNVSGINIVEFVADLRKHFALSACNQISQDRPFGHLQEMLGWGWVEEDGNIYLAKHTAMHDQCSPCYKLCLTLLGLTRKQRQAVFNKQSQYMKSNLKGTSTK